MAEKVVITGYSFDCRYICGDEEEHILKHLPIRSELDDDGYSVVYFPESINLKSGDTMSIHFTIEDKGE